MSDVTYVSNVKAVQGSVDNACQRALEICGGLAEGYAKQLCPVDTGRLRNSITHARVDDETEIIGTNVEYAPFVELGYVHTSGKKIPAKPFLRPAAEDHSEQYKYVFETELRRG